MKKLLLVLSMTTMVVGGFVIFNKPNEDQRIVYEYVKDGGLDYVKELDIKMNDVEILTGGDSEFIYYAIDGLSFGKLNRSYAINYIERH